MTEKRFYYNTFYYPSDMDRVMEYEIIDSESYPNYPNHDEKEDIPNWFIYISENDSGWQDMVVDLLNEQDQKIKELEQELFTERVQRLDERLAEYGGPDDEEAWQEEFGMSQREAKKKAGWSDYFMYPE